MEEPVDATVGLLVVASVEDCAVVSIVDEADVVVSDSIAELVVDDSVLVVDDVGRTDSVDGPVVETCVLVVGKVRLTMESCEEVVLEVASDVVVASIDVLDVVANEEVELVSEAVVLSVVEILVAPAVRGLGRP